MGQQIITKCIVQVKRITVHQVEIETNERMSVRELKRAAFEQVQSEFGDDAEYRVENIEYEYSLAPESGE